MDELLFKFWGKLNEDRTLKLPLICHSADVAAVCEALLDIPIIRRCLAFIGGLDDLDLCRRERLCVLAGEHDIGKFGHGFQNKQFTDSRFKSGHIKEVLPFFDGEGDLFDRFVEAIGFYEMSEWATDPDSVEQLLLASISHHGKPAQRGGNVVKKFWESTSEGDPIEGIAALTRALKVWFPCAWGSGAPLPANSAFQHVFSGLLMLADWIASDTYFFPLPRDNEAKRLESVIDYSRSRARLVLAQMGIDTASTRQFLFRRRPSFYDVFGCIPYDTQRELFELTPSSLGSLTILESSTGSGKTEAALAYYMSLFIAGLVDGLYFALPTRTAATQIFERLGDYVEKMFPDPDIRPARTLAVPGYLAFDETKGVRLSRFEVLWEDDDTDRAHFRGWASEHSKRYLAGNIVVGTVDQVLLSHLATKHAHMRAVALMRHLLVIDEVHASDVYMTRLTEEVLKWQLKAGGHALLMSATLGGTVRQRLIHPGERIEGPTLVESEAAPFPMITHRDRGDSPVKEVTFLAGAAHPASSPLDRALNVTVERRGWMFQAEKVASEAFEAASLGAHVLIIRNTVSECLKTQGFLEKIAGSTRAHLFACRGAVAPHHSRFSQADRGALDQAVEVFFGKTRSETGVVLAATQTIQQSLDLDSDLLITDLCPMDVLLQRLGRLYRHPRELSERPVGFRKARVIVLVPEERDLEINLLSSGEPRGRGGIGSVYEDLCILEATWRLLEQRDEVRLPDECRKLVENSIHKEVLEAIAKELGEVWIKHRGYIEGSRIGQSQTAKFNLVDWSAPFGSKESLFPEGVKIGTRLGEGDRWVRFSEPFMSPFGNEVSLLTLPEYQARGMDDKKEIEVGELELIEEGVRFWLGNQRFLYDRWGLRLVGEEESEQDGGIF